MLAHGGYLHRPNQSSVAIDLHVCIIVVTRVCNFVQKIINLMFRRNNRILT